MEEFILKECHIYYFILLFIIILCLYYIPQRTEIKQKYKSIFCMIKKGK